MCESSRRVHGRVGELSPTSIISGLPLIRPESMPSAEITSYKPDFSVAIRISPIRINFECRRVYADLRNCDRYQAFFAVCSKATFVSSERDFHRRALRPQQNKSRISSFHPRISFSRAQMYTRRQEGDPTACCVTRRSAGRQIKWTKGHARLVTSRRSVRYPTRLWCCARWVRKMPVDQALAMRDLHSDWGSYGASLQLCPICIRSNQRNNHGSERRSNPGCTDRSS